MSFTLSGGQEGASLFVAGTLAPGIISSAFDGTSLMAARMISLTEHFAGGAGGYSAAESFWCAIVECSGDRDDYVQCWGDNDVYKLGDGTTTDSWSTPVTVAGLPGGNYTSLSCGTHSSCVVVDGEAVWCWGDNTYSQSSPPSSLA